MYEKPDRHRTLVRFRMVRRFPRAVPIGFGALFLGGIAALDWATGPAVSVTPLFALAVMGVTWLGNRRHGMLVSGLASAQSLAAHVLVSGGLAVSALWNAATSLGVLMLITALVDALRGALIEQRDRAMIDPLTGAMNRRAFHLVAERERIRAGRTGSAVTLAYFDLDDFKDVNDRFGHEAGDRLLRVFAAVVRAETRGSDVLCRIGGDEFVLMLPDTDARAAVVVVDRVRNLLAQCCESEVPSVTVSVGISTYRFPPSTVDAMLAGADQLMYQAKAAGGDTVVGSVIAGPWTHWSDQVAETEDALEWV
ncbi:MAG: GGDEF domain-containing protein [Acidimicrobiia bacterium]